jgi:hypothetical protein
MVADNDESVEIPAAVADLAARYRRVERPLSGGLALLVGLLGAGALVVLPLGQGVVVAAVVLVAARAPVLRRTGRLVLATDIPPEAVEIDLRSATPPVLPFQWGVADSVRRTADGGRYEFVYLFGLRSVTMETAVADTDERLELTVTGADRPWATYTVTTREDGDRTLVEVELASDRRFGLRRVPQWLVAERYREAALEAQGYSVVEREGSVGP